MCARMNVCVCVCVCVCMCVCMCVCVCVCVYVCVKGGVALACSNKGDFSQTYENFLVMNHLSFDLVVPYILHSFRNSSNMKEQELREGK